MPLDSTKWFKQSPDKPLFPDILWSRPENRAAAGKVLIVGGEAGAFSAPATAYTVAEAAGIGTARVLLPDSLRKAMGGVFAQGDFAPSTPSGSFGQESLAMLLDGASWADGVLLAGDIGANSETTVVLEKFAEKHKGMLTITGDTLDHFLPHPGVIADRPQTIIAGSLKQLQRLAIGLSSLAPIYQRMDLLQLVESLQKLSAAHPASFITLVNTSVVVAQGGKVSSTNLGEGTTAELLQLATQASVFAIQSPSKLFEAITVSVAH